MTFQEAVKAASRENTGEVAFASDAQLRDFARAIALPVLMLRVERLTKRKLGLRGKIDWSQVDWAKLLAAVLAILIQLGVL